MLGLIPARNSNEQTCSCALHEACFATCGALYSCPSIIQFVCHSPTGKQYNKHPARIRIGLQIRSGIAAYVHCIGRQTERTYDCVPRPAPPRSVPLTVSHGLFAAPFLVTRPCSRNPVRPSPAQVVIVSLAGRARPMIQHTASRGVGSGATPDNDHIGCVPSSINGTHFPPLQCHAMPQ